MPRKKSRDKAAGGNAGPFRSDPFKQLKGFAVSAAPGAKPEEPKRSADSVTAVEDDADLFAREMGRLGVSGTGGEVPRAPEEPGGGNERTSPPPPASDRELFLQALKGMDTVFEDSFPREEEAQATPRRMKLIRQGRLAPEATLDLHGLTREEARTKVRHFLDDSVYQGRKTVLIVTGRGKRSESEPVLRTEVERYLTAEAGVWVSEWGRAPGRYGGEGALVVFLKKGSKGI